MLSKTLLLLGALAAFTVAEDAPVISNNAAGASYVATLQNKNTTTVRGTVTGTSGANGKGVVFDIDLTGIPATGAPFIYHIHAKPVPSDGNCTGAGAHLDPYLRGEVPICDASAPQTCQTGDLSGKHGNVTAPGSFKVSYLDPYLSTTPGDKSYFGNLSIVFHTFNKTRLNCANFTLKAPASSSAISSALSTAASGVAASSGAATATSTPSSTVISPPIATAGAATFGVSFTVLAAVAGLVAFAL